MYDFLLSSPFLFCLFCRLSSYFEMMMNQFSKGQLMTPALIREGEWLNGKCLSITYYLSCDPLPFTCLHKKFQWASYQPLVLTCLGWGGCEPKIGFLE